MSGRALPVKPVICVARKWERVIAAEVIAGIGILKGPNGCIYENNIETEKQQERRQGRAFHSQVLTLSQSVLSTLCTGQG